MLGFVTAGDAYSRPADTRCASEPGKADAIPSISAADA
jgi:hypothetical protein